jgi:uncharacterized protein YraI/beta-lactamase class A
MKRLLPMPVIIGFVAIFALIPSSANLQSTEVFAEAVGQANLRSSTDVGSTLLGQIQSGTRYPVIGRSEFYPWLLLGDPVNAEPIGWVFIDLVTIYGNTATVPYSTLDVGTGVAIPTSTQPAVEPPATFELVGVALPTATATFSATVIGLVLGEINVRYGPGVDYPRVGVAREGERFEITAWHTQLPWIQVRYPGAPNGYGWVAAELLEIQGDIFGLPSISQTTFNLPTLTPTSPAIQQSSLFEGTPVPLSPEFRALGEGLWGMMLEAEFEPETSRLGALFLLDLQTGEAITFDRDIAFSGMSLNKIAVMTALYRELNSPPDSGEALSLANSMVCSENTATNQVLSIIGGGDPYRGSLAVNSMMGELGLGQTYIAAPFAPDPRITPQPVSVPVTSADQQRADPDPFNQMTVDQLGWLLGSIYQCATNESGPLMSTFPGAYEARECQQMLYLMSKNRINALIEVGVPPDTRVAHKHGWIPDTHGDAGIVFTPGGNYVLVIVLHNPTWLDFSESFPLIAEISRAVYNYYNPDAPVENIRPADVPDANSCTLFGSPVVEILMSGSFSE